MHQALNDVNSGRACPYLVASSRIQPKKPSWSIARIVGNLNWAKRAIQRRRQYAP